MWRRSWSYCGSLTDAARPGFVYTAYNEGQARQVIFSVKAGHTTVSHVRDLRGVIEREKCDIGCLLTMEPTTKPMRDEALEAGHYTFDMDGRKFPRIQLLNVEELLGGKGLQLPPWSVNMTFKQATRSKASNEKNLTLFDIDED